MNNANFLGNYFRYLLSKRVSFFFLSLFVFTFFCCREILAFLATQNSCVNKVHVMLCYKMQIFDTRVEYDTIKHFAAFC